jgi:hypothetical protein
VSEVAESLSLALGTTSQLIRRLDQRGLLIRHREPYDERVIFVPHLRTVLTSACGVRPVSQKVRNQKIPGLVSFARRWPIGTSVTSGSSSRTGRSEAAVTEMAVKASDCEPAALGQTTLGALIDCGATEGRQSVWAQVGVSVQTGASTHFLQSGIDAFGPVRSGGAHG